MPRSWDITGDEIDAWSHRYDAPSVLPDLVRRLLLATSPLSSITMSAHAGTRLPGFDGQVYASGGTAFCPDGLSVWELTVQGDKDKLQKDFKKRSSGNPRVNPASTTYVAVSGRRVADPARWVAERRAEGIWREVRLLQADDLAAWLATAPAVARWFGATIGHPAAGGEDLDGFLDGWCKRTAPPLPKEIVLAGDERARLAESVRTWARSAKRDSPPLRIFGDTWEEAAIFATAALALDASTDGEQVRARVVVARSHDVLRSLNAAGDAQSLIVTAFAGASVDAGRVVLAMEGPAPEITFDAIRLLPVPYLRFAERLSEAGMPEAEAARHAKNSGGSLAVLQRGLGYVALPRWAEGQPVRALSTMLLAGAFEPNNPEDCDVLEYLGAGPGEVELLCERLRIAPDAPTLREEGRWSRPVWRWRAPKDAWNALVGQLPADTLRRFGEVVRLVLSERDPSLDLAPEQRFVASMYGKVLRASEPLRKGLVESLVRLSQHDVALSLLHGEQRGSRLATQAVHELLPPPWGHWASLARLLPLLAEAAPGTFLDCVDASLRRANDGVAHLLAEETRMGASPHTGLLWALETLGWDGRLMPRVASALGKLAEYDALLERPGRMANRPKASVSSLLRLALPQTNATADQRLHEMERRLAETPDVGFQVLVEQLRSLRGGVMWHDNPTPAILPIALLTRDELIDRTNREHATLAASYIELAFDYAGQDGDRWADLVRGAGAQGYVLGPQVLERLERVRSGLRDEHARLWDALREVLHWSASSDVGAADNASDLATRRQRWKSLYEQLTPADMVLRFAWLFLPGADVHHPDHQDMAQSMAAVEKARSEAIETIGGKENRLATLVALAENVGKNRCVLGEALGRSTLTPELDTFLLDGQVPPSFAPQIPAYLGARWQGQGSEGKVWVELKLRGMLSHGRQEEVADTLVKWSGPDVWDIVDALGGEVRDDYWKHVDRVFAQRSPEIEARAISNLLGAGNVVAAVRAVHAAKDLVTADQIALVLSALLSIPGELRRFAADPMFSYTLEALMGRLEAEPEVGAKYADLLAGTELAYAQHTHERRRPLRRLSAAFAANDGLFIDLVMQMYGEDEPAGELSKEERAERQSRAETAYRVLNSWPGYPGDEFATERAEPILYDWALRVLRALAGQRRTHAATSEVARVLARPGSGEDGCWPCVAARRLIESGEFPDLASALSLAMMNRRGATSRSLAEGGRQERALVDGFRTNAMRLRSEWPRTADMLDKLGDSYEHEAVRQDAEARITMREHGAEPRDFEAVAVTPPRSPQRRVVARGIVRLDSIELDNIALFEHLAIPLTPPNHRGQWLVLVGENGRGKSTILRAIVLALAGANVAHAALGELRAPVIRLGQSSARCTVTCGTERFSTLVSNDGTRETPSCQPANGPRPHVFAFGCRRGSAIGGNDSPDLASPLSDVATLFRESAGVGNAANWLKDMKLRAVLDANRYDAIFSAVTTGLCKLLPDVEGLDVTSTQVLAIAPRLGGRVPLAALSDGYLTTFGWLADMVARWLHWAEQVGESTEGNFFERMEGLVLVDEIDLHLHPSWQRRIIPKLKEVFPRLSFVVTTHNPMTLLGVEAHEILVLQESTDGSNRLEAREFDLPPGIRMDQVLTGEWFGLAYAVDDETFRLVEQHQGMLREGVDRDDPARRALEETLARRYGSYADTSLDRMALDVAADLMRDRQPKTANDRAELQRKLVERVKAKLADRERGEAKS